MEPKKQKALAIFWAFVAGIWFLNVILDLALKHQTPLVLLLHIISWLASTLAAVSMYLSWKKTNQK